MYKKEKNGLSQKKLERLLVEFVFPQLNMKKSKKK
jgi:hypothetical protein